MKIKVPPAAVERLATSLIRALGATIRKRHFNDGPITDLSARNIPYIVTLWHGQLIMMPFARFRRPIVVLVSQHRDGELISRVLVRLGARTARGSTTRGGSSGLRQLVHAAKEGMNLGITPDGPRGPRHQVQPGVIVAAQLSGAPIVPVAFVAKKKSF